MLGDGIFHYTPHHGQGIRQEYATPDKFLAEVEGAPTDKGFRSTGPWLSHRESDESDGNNEKKGRDEPIQGRATSDPAPIQYILTRFQTTNE
jgi:hypothetical protein